MARSARRCRPAWCRAMQPDPAHTGLRPRARIAPRPPMRHSWPRGSRPSGGPCEVQNVARHRQFSRFLVSTRQLVGHRRRNGSDVVLAVILAAVAGAANAGGFFALGQYTSHMTGYLSQLADNLVLGNLWIAMIAILAIGAFATGAAFSTILINWARTHTTQRQYALPIALQGVFLLCFAGGGWFTGEAGRLFALCCLCFIMGMQNATITKISGARIRTTHCTGIVTDIGIELGRAAFRHFNPGTPVAFDRAKLGLLALLIVAFVLGGLTGALGYGHAGFLFSLPLGLTLLALAMPGLRRRGPRIRRA